MTTDQTQTTESLADLATVYQKIAVKWLIWQMGKTTDEARAALERWPVDPEAADAVDVATFIVEQCNGG